MILDVYKDAFEYSAQDWTALIKLGLINVIGMFIFLPIFLSMGYTYRVVKIAVHGMINGYDELPEFDEWAKMFVEGIKLFVVEVVYSLIPFILFLLVIFLAYSIGGTAGAIVLILGIVIGIVVSVLFALMSIIAIAKMTENDDKLSAAFDISGIIEVIESIGWVNAVGTWIGLELILFAIYMIVFGILYAIVLFLGISTAFLSTDVSGGVFSVGMFIIVMIINFLLAPYLGIFQYRVYGLLYNLQ